MTITRRTLLAGSAATTLLAACRADTKKAPSPSESRSLSESRSRQSLYVPVSDGTRLAVDVWLPAGVPTQRIGTVARLTRYHRSTVDSIDDPTEASDFLARGWALVKIDARGTGASFGSRTAELTKREIEDYSEVIDWVAAQSWSNGRVAAYGVSYAGTAADLVAGTGNAHLVAVAPLFSDVDTYRHLAWPGGVLVAPLTQWLLANDVLDGVDGAAAALSAQMGVDVSKIESEFGQVAPVDGGDGPVLLQQALREHQRNRRLSTVISELECIDDSNGDVTWVDLAVLGRLGSTAAANVPRFVQVGWLDAGTVDGAVERFSQLEVPQLVQIAPWAHGGDPNDTLTTDGGAADPRLATPAQIESLLEFFDRYLNDQPIVAMSSKLSTHSMVQYRLAGDDRWYNTPTWPPTNITTATIDLDRQLADANTIRYDPRATTGNTGRWVGNLFGAPVNHDQLAVFDADLEFELLVAEDPIGLVGAPQLAVSATPDRTDVALHAYLVARIGRTTTILSEAHRRLGHQPGPSGQPTYRRVDLRPMEVGQNIDADLSFTTIGVRLPRSTRLALRLSLGDADTFRPITNEPHTLTIHSVRLALSVIDS
jgi:uncharacterized protein